MDFLAQLVNKTGRVALEEGLMGNVVLPHDSIQSETLFTQS